MPKVTAAEAFTDIEGQLNKWLAECATGKHTTNHPGTHIKGVGYQGGGNAEIESGEYKSLEQLWTGKVASLPSTYAKWTCDSSGSFHVGTSGPKGKPKDFCIRCDSCAKAKGFGGVAKSPTFAYHIEVV